MTLTTYPYAMKKNAPSWIELVLYGIESWRSNTMSHSFYYNLKYFPTSAAVSLICVFTEVSGLAGGLGGPWLWLWLWLRLSVFTSGLPGASEEKRKGGLTRPEYLGSSTFTFENISLSFENIF